MCYTKKARLTFSMKRVLKQISLILQMSDVQYQTSFWQNWC